MRNLLAFAMTLLLTLGGLGYYLDWFKIRTTAGVDGHTTLNIDMNTVKALQDGAKFGAKVTEVLDKKAKDAETQAEADKKAKDDVNKTSVKDPLTKPGNAID